MQFFKKKQNLMKYSVNGMTLKVEITWQDSLNIDVFTFMLGENGRLVEVEDLVFYNSELRWKPAPLFACPDYDPFDGTPSEFSKEVYARKSIWRNNTIPTSSDHSVLGPYSEMSCWDEYGIDESGPVEPLFVRVGKINTEKYKRIIFVASIYNFEQCSTSFLNSILPVQVKITDWGPSPSPLLTYSLSIDCGTVCFGELIWDEVKREWVFRQMAERYKGGIERMIDKYG